MSTAVGPEIVNNRLQYSMDMSNTKKSWKGPPATNLLVQSGDFSTWSSVGSHEAPTTLVLDPDGNYGAQAWAADSSTGWHETHQSYTVTSGITYTYSIYVKAGAAGTFYTQLHQAAFGGWKSAQFNLVNGTANISGTNASGSIVNVGNGWFRCSVTAPATSSVSVPFYIYSQNTTYTGAGSSVTELYVYGAQLETGSVATPYIPTGAAAASRTTSQCLLDLANNATVSGCNLTYASDGTFSFNGSSNYIELTSSVNIINKSFTAEAWIQRSVTGAVHGIASDLQYGWWAVWIGNTNRLESKHKFGTGTSEVTNYLGGTLNVGTSWTQIAVVYDISTGIKSQYVNGELDATTSISLSFNLSGTDRGPRFIGIYRDGVGSGTPNAFNGTIASLKLYDTALSAAEVKQNFAALRGRYGI